MKRIILLSDGTGNSSAKLFKTNVWRLYQSLDLENAASGVRQVACYADGVGTSGFKPLAVLGGVFGYGLKRNILHLYEFLCRHWEEGDEIWLFGFSRGAFTVRTLAGMIAREGVLRHASEQEMSYAARDVYRRYRADRGKAKNGAIPDPPLVPPLRRLRDWAIHLWRKAKRQEEFPPHNLRKIEHIHFIGVWDTVAAYGSPFEELTLGIDRFIFQLSMPNRDLNPKVLHARQALALDDERDTFHPLLWNEPKDGDPERIKQVWFAGMHSDLGGGYPDDALSVHPLVWMMHEAESKGLEYLPQALERFSPPPSRSAVLHDSRQGLAGYYRYQPRRLSAYLLPQDPETLMMIDPRLANRAHLREVLLHRSVIERIRDPSGAYSPIVLTDDFRVVEPCGSVSESLDTAPAKAARSAGGAAVWDDVWKRRAVYQCTVLTSFILFTLPIWGSSAEARACENMACAVSPLFRALGYVVPAAGLYWTEAFANNPAKTLALAGLLWVFMAWSAGLQRRIHDRMTALFAPWRGLAIPFVPDTRPWIRRFRRSAALRVVSVNFKWEVMPTVFGVAGLLVTATLLTLPVAVSVLRHQISRAEEDGRLCGEKAATRTSAFELTSTCWDTSTAVQRDVTYLVTLTVETPWLDQTIPAGPKGFDNAALPYLGGYVLTAAKRAVNGRWYQPHVTIIGPGNDPVVQPLEFQDDGKAFIARLTPQRSGHVYLWVNDATFPFFGKARSFYANNKGSASVTILPMTGARQ